LVRQVDGKDIGVTPVTLELESAYGGRELTVEFLLDGYRSHRETIAIPSARPNKTITVALPIIKLEKAVLTTWQLKTEPAGAAAFVNDKRVCTATPCTMAHDLGNDSTVTVILRKDNFADATLTLTPDDLTPAVVTLASKK